MLKIDQEKLLQEPTVRKVNYDGEIYFCVEDVAKYLKEEITLLETVKLPIKGEYLDTARIETIEKGRKQEDLSEFNKALLKMKNFKDK